MKDLTFRQKVIQGIHDLFYIWKREFGTTFRDQGVLIFFVLVPLVYPLIYAFIYTNETIHEVPTVVVDDSRSSLSREYLRKVDSSPEVSLVSYCADMEEAKLMLKDRRAYGIIYIPSTFSDDIVRGKQTQVSIFCDMSGLLYYKALLTANTNVSLAMNADIKVERSANTTDRQDEITAYPIEYEDVALYNPTNGFAAFLIPAVLVLIIQQTMLLGIGLSAGTPREQNRFRDLVPINRHYNGTLRIVMGKGLSYFMVYSLVSVYILCVVPWLFSLNQIAIPGVLTLFTLPYLAACIFFAMTASIAIRNRETCMLLFVFTSVRCCSSPAFHGRELLCPLSGSTSRTSSLLPSASTATYASTAWEPHSMKSLSSTKHYGYKRASTSSPRAWYIAGRYCRAGNM